MFSALRRWWSHLTAKLVGAFNEKADPRVQLDQAIAAAKASHQQLKDQVTVVIANQKRADLELQHSLDELSRVTGEARSALVAADGARRSGDVSGAARHEADARSLAADLVRLEAEIETGKSTLLEATRAADRAKGALAQSSTLLQARLTERSRLVAKLDEIGVQERLQETMQQLGEGVGGDTPTLGEIRDRIDQRYAEAKAHAELADLSIDRRIEELETAVAADAASSRLDELRAETGLAGSGPTSAAGSSEQTEPSGGSGA